MVSPINNSNIKYFLSIVFSILFTLPLIQYKKLWDNQKEADSHNNPLQINKPHNAFIWLLMDFLLFLLPKKSYCSKVRLFNAKKGGKSRPLNLNKLPR